MSLAVVGLMAVTILLSWCGTGLMRAYALRHHILDVPGDRSSHQIATPRGGGGGLVVAAMAGFAVVSWTWHTAMPAEILAAGLVVGAIGMVDDHGHVSPHVRLIGHFVAAALVVSALGGHPPLPVSGELYSFGLWGDGLAVVLVVWLINLTNFMDGIDGITGTEVISVCLVGAALLAFTVPGDPRWIEPAVLAAAVAGFLIWNWPPARIFMGDVGSGFLGLMIAVVALRAAWINPVLGWCWLILYAVFIVDSTVTLLARLLRGAPVLHAHRTHAYQHLAAAWASHRRVTLLVLAANLLWLSPLAWLVATGRLDGPVGVSVAYLPLAAVAIRAGAGRAGRPC